MNSDNAIGISFKRAHEHVQGPEDQRQPGNMCIYVYMYMRYMHIYVYMCYTCYIYIYIYTYVHVSNTLSGLLK